MSEYVKDNTRLTGWKVISYRHGKMDDGAPVTAEGMDEGGSDAGEGDAEPDSSMNGTGQWLLE